jgi:predicted secreted protein
MSITLGNDMVLYRNSVSTGNAFGASTNCTLTVNTSQLEVTTAASGNFIQVLPTTTSFEITADGFVTMYDIGYYELLLAQKNSTLLNVKFRILNPGGNITINADVYITSISLTGPAEGAGTYSITLQGTGPYDFI